MTVSADCDRQSTTASCAPTTCAPHAPLPHVAPRAHLSFSDALPSCAREPVVDVFDATLRLSAHFPNVLAKRRGGERSQGAREVYPGSYSHSVRRRSADLLTLSRGMLLGVCRPALSGQRQPPHIQHGLYSNKMALITSGLPTRAPRSAAATTQTTWTIFQQDGPNHLGLW